MPPAFNLSQDQTLQLELGVPLTGTELFWPVGQLLMTFRPQSVGPELDASAHTNYLIHIVKERSQTPGRVSGRRRIIRRHWKASTVYFSATVPRQANPPGVRILVVEFMSLFGGLRHRVNAVLWRPARVRR
jgi:hypothetical protein